MRKIFTAVLGFVVVAAFSVMAHAAGGYSVEGKVVSIDPAGKTIVIDTMEGEKTVVFQETTKGFADVKPGQSVKMTCIDLEGKSCAQEITVISASEAMMPTKTFEGEIVSIDSAGKVVVIKTPKGEEMTIEMVEESMVEQVMPMEEAAVSEEALGCEPMPVKLLRPGQMVRMECFDSGDKFCASKVTVISAKEAGMPVPGATEVVGEIAAIDPGGKTVVIKTVTGEKTLYYQKITGGLPFDALERGKKVKAYCIDVEGQSCIKDITAAE